MDINERLSFFSSMIRCCHNLYFWNYDAAFHLIESTCPDETAIGAFLRVERSHEMILEYAKDNDTPLIITSAIRLMWTAVFEKEDGILKNVYILGPYFIDDNSPQNIESRLRKMELSAAFRRDAVRFMQSLPVISLNRIMEYSIMFHYAVTEKEINVSDLTYRDSDSQSGASSGSGAVSTFTQKVYDQTGPAGQGSAEPPIIHGSYAAEQEMLRMVREGDLNYEKKKQKLSLGGNIGKLSNDNDGRQFKNAVLVCIVLFSRAAIEGGLSPEVSMTLTDHYFQSVEACRSIQELKEISETMQTDFIRRVHKCRQNMTYSRPVRNCCDYIDLHLEEPVRLEELAREMGYTEYYLTKKFRQETGKTLKEYIREKRIERARFLLTTTDLSIHDISERLQFGSQSYFTETFRKAVGIHPTAYREENS